jgi:hypothetical protein
MIAGLMQFALLTGLCGCGACHQGILHPRDYGSIGATPHCVSGHLVRNPLFFGHRPTRWRHWPSDYVTWRYSASECYEPTEENVLFAPETITLPPDKGPSEDLPATSDPFDAGEEGAEPTSQNGIERLPTGPGAPEPATLDELFPMGQ